MVGTAPLDGDRTAATATVLDLFPYATSSPAYLAVGGRPARSRADAEYFVAWLDRTREAVEAHPDWNTGEEKRDVLDMLARARAEFVGRAAE